MLLGFFTSPGLECGGAKGEDFAGGGANGDSSFLEYHSVDGGIERRALNIEFELVLAAFGGASESAPTDLGLGSPRGNPRVAPCSDNTGSDGRDGGFGKGLIRGPMIMARILVRRVFLSNFTVLA